ncbi:MAG: cupin domain-containing protein [Actinobacteria bacterium]|nr:cupin domain-containing protein [Actinomycetota bacterium]
MEFVPEGKLEEFFHSQQPDDVQKLVAKAADAPSFKSPEMNLVETYPAADLPVRTVGFHIGEIEGKSSGGTHRHLCEAVLYILEGRGYSLINGERVDYGAGDAICIPPMSWHSHHTDEDQSLKMIGIWDAKLMESFGLYFNEELGDGQPDAERNVRSQVMPDSRDRL